MLSVHNKRGSLTYQSFVSYALLTWADSMYSTDLCSKPKLSYTDSWYKLIFSLHILSLHNNNYRLTLILHKTSDRFKLYTVNSDPRLLNLILINLIVRWPSECSHYINNLWNATFGLWKIRIMNGWMVSFEWKTRKHHENWELVATLWFNFESFRR